MDKLYRFSDKEIERIILSFQLHDQLGNCPDVLGSSIECASDCNKCWKEYFKSKVVMKY